MMCYLDYGTQSHAYARELTQASFSLSQARYYCQLLKKTEQVARKEPMMDY